MVHVAANKYDFEKINILEYAFGQGGGGHQKAYAVYAFINVDNCERPLSMPASNSVMIREIPGPATAHSVKTHSSLITHTKGPILHLQLYYSNHSFDFRYNTHITHAIDDGNGITRYTRCSVFQKLLI